MRLQYLLVAVVALATCGAITAADTKVEHSTVVDQTHPTSESGAEKRFLRSAKTLDGDDEDLLDLEERRGLSTTQVKKMLGEIDRGVIKDKYFKYYDSIDAKPDMLYVSWGFARNGVNHSDPRYKFWEGYRDWFYKKYPVE